MTKPDFTHATWRASSHSSGQGQCVEVAMMPCAVAPRDSKDPDSPVLVFTSDGWQAFIHGVVTK
ncbi:DUF397 domain-containing protein [Streptomyces halstedii]|uniref:DUF397 domain-containing protein n=1 Tax=Streptomyces halstedii TaxID=1944 RepID=UPI0034613995